MSFTSEEMAAARATLNKSARFARSFRPMLGGLDARGRFAPTVADQKYWFAKLYELITYYEITSINTFRNPGFVLTFIPIFFDLYFNAVQRYGGGNEAGVHRLWLIHLRGRPNAGHHPTSASDWEAEVQFSIASGVTAHIQGDMATGLAAAYRAYQPSPKPAFGDLRDDFMNPNSRLIFERAKAAFFLDLSRNGPFPVRPELGQFIIAVGEQVVGGPISLDAVWRWRESAWNEADRILRTPGGRSRSGRETVPAGR